MFQSFHAIGIVDFSKICYFESLHLPSVNVYLLQLTAAERENYSKLALEIFSKYAPKDGRYGQNECPHCTTPISDW